MAAKLDSPRMEVLVKLHHLTAQKDKEPLSKTVVAFLRRSGEGMLGRLLVEMVVVLSADSAQVGSKLLAEAAIEYSINVDEIGTAVRKEFAEREKAKASKKAR
jgi:ParB family chromosome partitioning protein